MNRIVLSALLCPLFGVMAYAQSPNEGALPAAPALLGAYAPAAADSPVVLEAKHFLQSRMVSVSLGEVCVAYTQVVDGLNVKLVCNAFEEGHQASWKFVACKSLDGIWHFGVAERL